MPTIPEIPAKFRQAIYAIVAFAGTIVAIPELVPAPYQAKVIAAIAAVTNLLAAFHVTKPEA